MRTAHREFIATRSAGRRWYAACVIATRATLAKVTAARLVQRRATRYRSDEQAVALLELSPSDRASTIALYDTLARLSRLLAARSAARGEEILRAFAASVDTADLVQSTQQLGGQDQDERVSQALHDIRGGTLSACLILIGRVSIGKTSAAADELAYMTRDHLKIMRNVIADLDVAGRQHDLQRAPHSLDKLLTALPAYAATVNGKALVVKVDIDVDEAPAPPIVIAETCTELGAVDRVAYNLLGNAARFAAEPVVDVWVTVLAADLRVAVTNLVSADQQRAVRAALAEDRSALFGGFTTGGTGLGLRIAADLVGRAYGVPCEMLRDGGYVGAKLVGPTFVSWFHWPLA